MHHTYRLQPCALLVVLAVLGFVSNAARAAGTADDTDDPFREKDRVATFVQLGADLSKEHRLRFTFRLKDCPKNRAGGARHFAENLQRLGFQDVATRPCTRVRECWQVTASKTMRVAPKTMVFLSKQLERLAVVDDGHYIAWEAEGPETLTRLNTSPDTLPRDMPPAIRSAH